MFSKVKNEYFIFFISFLIYFPIILWGGYFLDDNYRSIDAFYGWTGDYRPVSDWIFYLLGFGEDFTDTAPLNYIIQFFILSYFNIFFTNKIQKIFLLDKSFKNYISLSVSLIFLSPFFIQNLYFRYDSLIMVISIIIACIPFFFNNKKIDLLCCILVLFTYQSSIVGYICIVVLRLLKIIQMNEHVLLIYKEILISFSVFLIAIVIFTLTANFLISPNVYAKNHTSIVTSFEMFAENIRYSFNILSFSSSLVEYAISITFIIIGILFIYNIIYKNKKINNLNRLIIIIGILFIYLICLLNINTILIKPRLYTRTYIGVGFVLFLSGVSLIITIAIKDKILKKYNYFFKFILLSIFLICINIFYSAHNYIKETENYTKDIVNNISYDLSIIGKNHYNFIMIYGESYTPLRSKVLANRYPILLNIFYDNEIIFFYKFARLTDLLKNKGFIFDEIGYRGRSYSKEYNQYANAKPNIERLQYNIVITKDNKLFIYFKKNGNLIKSPLTGNRLD